MNKQRRASGTKQGPGFPSGNPPAPGTNYGDALPSVSSSKSHNGSSSKRKSRR